MDAPPATVETPPMIRLGADLCLAFIRADSPATHTATLATAAGIPTTVIRAE